MDPEFLEYKQKMATQAKPLPQDLQKLLHQMGVTQYLSNNPHVRIIQDLLRKYFPRWEELPHTPYLEHLWDQLSSLVGEEDAFAIISQCIQATRDAKIKGDPKTSPHMRYFASLVLTQIKGWSGEIK